MDFYPINFTIFFGTTQRQPWWHGLFHPEDGRRIDRIHFVILGLGAVDNVEMSVSRQQDCTAGHNLMAFKITEYKFCFAFFNAEKLIDILVHLRTYLYTALETHHHPLGVLSREKNLPEVFVRFGQLFDIPNKKWILSSRSLIIYTYRLLRVLILSPVYYLLITYKRGVKLLITLVIDRLSMFAVVVECVSRKPAAEASAAAE